MLSKRTGSYHITTLARHTQADAQGKPSRKITSNRRRNKLRHSGDRYSAVIRRYNRKYTNGGPIKDVFTFSQVKDSLLPGDTHIEFVKRTEDLPFGAIRPYREKKYKKLIAKYTYVAPSGNTYTVYTDIYEHILGIKANGNWVPVSRDKDWWQEDQ